MTVRDCRWAELRLSTLEGNKTKNPLAHTALLSLTKADVVFGEIVAQSQWLPKITNSALGVNDNGPVERSHG